MSPQTQESDARAYGESRGYFVVGVYKDIERYKVGKRLVEPSGTRSDRPALKKMLSDARAGIFEIIIAWREDRLYRSYRPMLDVLDCIYETGIDLELVKETFDKRLAPVKAWAARMELDAKHDRFMMGYAGRLSRGKGLNHPSPYGYKRDEDGFYEIDEDEAEWVGNLFTWYADGVSIREIQRRFINGGAKQRNETKIAWHMAMLRRMLTEDYYWTGKHQTKWDGETYEIPLPVIISEDLAKQVLERKGQYKHYPAGNTRNNYLVAGLVYCAPCEVRCNIVSSNNGVKKDGSPKKYVFYQCSNAPNITTNNCFHRGSAKLIDQRVWEKVWNLISEPGAFESALRERIEQIQSEEINASEEVERLEGELDNLSFERQRVITWARKGTISEDDLETQLLALSWQENSLRRELADKRLLADNRAGRLVELAEVFQAQVKAGYDALSRQPETEEEAREQFDLKKRIIQAIVEKVEIHPDKSVTVYAHISLADSDQLGEVRIENPITCHS